MSITVALIRIERWLREHAPLTVASLRPPATMAETDTLAQTLGHSLPADVQRLYHWHDGAATAAQRFEIYPSFFFLPLHRAVDAWEFRNRIEAENLAADPDFRDWQRHWLPIATDDCGDYVVVETAGPHRGRMFVSDAENGAITERAWLSPQAWADDLLTALTTNHPFAGAWQHGLENSALTWRTPAP